MDNSLDKGRRVGQWPAARPELDPAATHSGGIERGDGQMDLDSEVAHIMITGCRISRG